MWQDIVRAKLKELDITQEQGAERCGLKKAAFGHYLTGRTPVKLSLLVDIADKLGIPPALLVVDDHSYFATSPQECELLDRFRSMEKIKQDALLSFMASPPLS